MLPAGTLARVDRASWTPPSIFSLVGSLGQVPRADLERTLNLGVGFVAVVPPEHADAAIARLAERDLSAWVLGEVHEREGAPVEEGVEVVQGAKGVDGGAVQVVGEHG